MKSSEGDRKIDIVTSKGDHYLHRQIEYRDGLTFMRLKKRPFVVIS